MASIQSRLGMAGSLGVKKIPAPMAPIGWRVRNTVRPEYSYLMAMAINGTAKVFSRLTGIVTWTTQLSLRHIDAAGLGTDYGIVGRRVVTTAFVDFMVDELQAETSVWGDFKFHDSGVGTTAAVIGDTDIETTDGESRATGTQTEGASSNIYRSVGTISYTTTKAITEHGLFSASTGAVLMDRTVFTVVNVVNGDSIQFTYELTVSSGG